LNRIRGKKHLLTKKKKNLALRVGGSQSASLSGGIGLRGAAVSTGEERGGGPRRSGTIKARGTGQSTLSGGGKAGRSLGEGKRDRVSETGKEGKKAFRRAALNDAKQGGEAEGTRRKVKKVGAKKKKA